MTRNEGFNISNNFESLPLCNRSIQFHRKPILYYSIKRSGLNKSCFNTYDTTPNPHATAYAKKLITSKAKESSSAYQRKGVSVSPEHRSVLASSKLKRLFPTEASRVFSNLHKKYRKAAVFSDRKDLAQVYMKMKERHNVNSIKVCGGKHINSDGQPFILYDNLAKGRKQYTVSEETFKEGWMEKWKSKITTNYESSKFNTISHEVGENNSITKMYLKDEKIFHRLKGITEYCDLSRVNAVNANERYNKILKLNPKCFYKKGEVFTQQCNSEKGYGPFFKLFKP